MAADITLSARLSDSEQTRLQQLEAVVERGLDAFIEVAVALTEIRDSRLYRATHATFEAYANERFGLARRTAYGYIEAAAVLPNVPPEAQLSVSHLRALAPLAPAEQRELAPVVSPMTVAEARRVIKEWRRQQRAAHTDLPAPPPLPTGTYRTLVADPPWRYEHDWGDGLAGDQYPTMTTDEICELPISDLAAPDSHLYLCATVPKIPDALQVCEAWGFRYVGMLTWVKPGLGLGTWWRVSTEHIVFGVKGKLATQPNLRNWFEAKRSRHSRKPDELYELVERASPGPYLEMFARRAYPGWACWGQEVEA